MENREFVSMAKRYVVDDVGRWPWRCEFSSECIDALAIVVPNNTIL